MQSIQAFLMIFKRSVLYRSLRDLWRVFLRFMNDESPRNAAALTYTSLFAVVPLLTVVYSMLAALPIFQDVGGELQSMLFEHFVPATGAVVQNYIGDFANQARQLTLVGAAFLILTAGLMIVNIEQAFNAIWRVEKPRRGLQAFLIYWTVLTLGPLLIGAGMVLSSYLSSLPLLEIIAEPVGGSSKLLRFLPFVLSAVAFTLLYWAVPHCPVRFRHAAIGGTAMALLFELAKKTFTWFVSSFPSYELIYGAFAAVPVFLLWIYVSWLLILFCAEWVAFQDLKEDSLQQQDSLPLSLQLLVLMQLLWQAFAVGEGVDESRLRQLIGNTNKDTWQRLQHWLESHHWMVYDTERECWMAGRDFSQVSFAEWLQTLPWRLPRVAEWPQELQGFDTLKTLLQQLEAEEQQRLSAPLPRLITQSTTGKQA